MPSPTAALTLIEDALSLVSSIGVDQTLTASEQSDGLRALCDLIEDFSIANLAVYGKGNSTFNTIAAQATYPIGIGSTWNTDRPQRIWEPVYTVISGATFPCLPMTQADYNLIGIKGQPGGYPLRYLFVNDFPFAQVTLWPVPDAVLPITFSIDRILAQVAAVGDILSFPPGYASAFIYNLAVRLAPLFGKRLQDFPDVVRIARETLAAIKRANRQPRVLQLDPSIVGIGVRRGWSGQSGGTI